MVRDVCRIGQNPLLAGGNGQNFVGFVKDVYKISRIGYKFYSSGWDWARLSAGMGRNILKVGSKIIRSQKVPQTPARLTIISPHA